MSPQSFCTFFDSNYAAQGLSLYSSLKKYAANNFSLYILCLDDELFNRLKNMDLNDPFIKKKALGKNFMHIFRVNGDLGVSRAFGDPEFKEPLQSSPQAYWSWPKGHSKKFTGSLVVCEPDVCTHNLSPEDDFIILACDGFIENPCGDAYPSTIKSGLATPSIR